MEAKPGNLVTTSTLADPAEPVRATRQCPALLTDLYELTMAYGYWKNGVQDRAAVFHLFYRKNPFGGGFGIVCGLGDVIAFLDSFVFTEEEIASLGTLTGSDGGPLFEPAFLHYLRVLEWSCDLDAMLEGSVSLSKPLMPG